MQHHARTEQGRNYAYTTVKLAWYCTVDSLVTTVVVVNKSLDSKEQIRTVFQRLVITGDSSYFAASSLSVSRSLRASMATFALSASWCEVIVL